MKKLPVTAIVLTYNEELNLEAGLKSMVDWAEEIFIVDSFSTDKTLEIAKKYTDKIYEHSFKNNADQLNWALDNLPIKGEWVFRHNADQRITPELRDELFEALPLADPEIGGFYIKWRIHFMGRWIKHGGYYPNWFFWVWRRGKARSEMKEMDEHIVLLEGRVGYLKNDLVDDDKKDLEWWVAKHNRYSTREALARGRPSQDKVQVKPRLFGSFVERKRWFKQNFYLKLPTFLRAFLYFIYRYFFQLGFLDGKEGLIFHFLQAGWHQFLIDAKIYEKKRQINRFI